MMNISIIDERIKVITFAAMIGISHTMMPYISHKNMPVVNIMYIGKERLLVSRVFMIFTAWGRNATVVHAAAINPTMVYEFII